MSLSRENAALIASDLSGISREEVGYFRVEHEAMNRLLNAARSVPLSVGVEEVVEALKPFAAFAEAMAHMGGNWPKRGEFYTISPAATGDRSLTVEDFQAAQSILSKLGREEDCSARADLSPASRSHTPSPDGWRDIESAPKDGTPILAFCVHANARHAGEDFAEWTEIVTTRWIDFNGGGWTWNGICGVHTHWMPLPAPPAENNAGQPSVASTGNPARDEPLPTPPDNP